MEREDIFRGEKMNKKVIRCAIYTRKSTEEGLDQDFNSLDAQREACEAYIKSQQHEGWTLVDKQYNDGGFSGGTLERPSLKELFKDIEDGKVDTVVVYKIDRLTRSLMDFSKIVEVFDKQSVTFVSITQQFNTTTSMGRLTLNILLSFAQFEREVTGERIRDKIAASKKKGMWMGGSVPIGYKLENKKLVEDKEHSHKVKLIFDKYLELKSVPELLNYLRENNILTRTDKIFTKGPLYHILQNPVYIGQIRHKDKVYQGEHPSIISQEIFEATQKMLTQNRVSNNCPATNNASLLAGKLFDDAGNRMSPSHSNTRNRRYRYYVSQAITQFRRQDAGALSKIPAGEIEKVVREEIRKFLEDKEKLHSLMPHLEMQNQKQLLLTAEKANPWENNIFIRAVLTKVVIYRDKLEIALCTKLILKALEALMYNTALPENKNNEAGIPILLITKIKLTKTFRQGGKILLGAETSTYEVNKSLVKAIAKSFYWNELILTGKAKNSVDIQKMENLKDNTYIKDVLRLRFLAPDIVEKILDGSNPPDWTVQKLFKVRSLDWSEQMKQLL